MRLLRRNPLFTLAAVLTLGVGIALNSAVFSILNVILFHPLPYRDARRIVALRQKNPSRGLTQQLASVPDYFDWKRENQVFESLAAWNFLYFNLTGADQPERVEGLQVTAGFFPVLGVTAALGRTFLPEEEQPGRSRVVLLSDSLWRRRFGADPSVPGRTIMVEGQTYTIAGVLPRDFRLFRVLNRDLDLYVPLVLDPAGASRADHRLFVYARLKPGVAIQQAQAAMDALPSPDNSGWLVEVVELQHQWTAEIRPILLMVQAAVGFVLLIACANVTSLLLARAAGRQKEMAIRTALGASRLRLVRQLLAESSVLGLLSGAAGTVLALGLIRLLNALPYSAVNREEPFRLDAPVLAFNLAIALLTGIAAGLAPALQCSVQHLKPDILRGRRVSSLLVSLEAALAVILLAGAGLLVRSSLAATGMDRGLDSRNLLTVQLWLPPARYSTGAQVAQFWRQAVEKVAALPGVESATAVNFLPLSTLWTSVGIHLDGAPAPRPGEEPQVHYWVVGPDYFHTAGIPLLAGRAFTEQDNDEQHGVAIVSASMARRFWPGESPLGKRIQPAFPNSNSYWLPRSQNQWLTVVGVARDVRLDGIVPTPLPQLYLPYAQNPSSILHLVVRTAADPMRWSPSVRRAVLSIDKDQPVFDVKTLEDVLAYSFTRAATLTRVLAAFAALAVLLAGLGIYGVVAYFVSQTTREVGIRMALGARPAQVAGLIVRQAMRAALAGVSIGLAGALAGARVLQGLLVGVAGTDAATLGAIAVFFLAVALAAAYVPARRAARVNPLTCLRHD
ncbi:Macrolide transporter ATP-binding /permease protein [Candidatus Sulfopaludibacter sp. SbA4]|nr:Macrolide transporter ATP-binding /permease protein [Candidatus Sulfopaludibacter sp. SbA4]